ncbi:protease inhibitor-like protein [Blastocystis sp. subtype 4]|uniref:protease inhibitor-like protein n=1 Tax=Blastocystis sp. subtype 4 TaxID=944170 RepID=UPI0007112A2C|nr:protease inhibitor-like protein [Blastocystis sp. subtype 4]KNB45612.1 protease inhibitor-like protein [Blastocystis sp. subtype 4]|eukprot:XP_014529055.1 protease inhibitor-like protein [Blastocystis sp. subtype 4]
MLFDHAEDMKMNWPECVGKKAEEAHEMVSKECPDVRIQVLTEHSPATMDYRLDRVRIITDSNGTVLAARRG